MGSSRKWSLDFVRAFLIRENPCYPWFKKGRFLTADFADDPHAKRSEGRIWIVLDFAYP